LIRTWRRPPGFDALDQLMHGIATIPHVHAMKFYCTWICKPRRAFSLALGLLEPAEGGVLLRTSADDLAWFARRLAGLPSTSRSTRRCSCAANSRSVRRGCKHGLRVECRGCDRPSICWFTVMQFVVSASRFVCSTRFRSY